MLKTLKQPVLGVIVGNRGFFPAHLCDSGRKMILKVLEKEGIKAVALTPEDTHFGSIESLAEAQKCADLFRAHRDEIDGILVTLPNFGDERAIANAIRWAGLNVPVLIQAFPDDVKKMTISDRRDSFCGKMSACNNLTQYGIKFSLTTLHTVDPESKGFIADLHRFVSICRIVKGLRGARLGAIGARPAAFNTVRFSEKLLEHSGISVETIDLSEIFGRAKKIKDDDLRIKSKLEEIRSYVNTDNVPDTSLVRMPADNFLLPSVWETCTVEMKFTAFTLSGKVYKLVESFAAAITAAEIKKEVRRRMYLFIPVIYIFNQCTNHFSVF